MLTSMPRVPVSTLLLAISTLCAPGRAVAQGSDCTIIESGNTAIFNGGTPQELVFIGGGARFRCPNGTTISSDSVARYRGQGLIEFIGHVRYTDIENRLTAGYVRYLERDRQAIAQGDVVLTDRQTGSVIRGPLMNYFQPGGARTEALIRIPSGRPHAVVVSDADSMSTRRDTTIVDADRMDITGRSTFNAWGTVQLMRSGLVGTGQEASYDRAGGGLRLARDASLTSDDYVLSGDTVRGRTNELDEIEELTARTGARLEGRDVDIDAPLIRLFFTEGEIQRLVAIGGTATESGDSVPAALDPSSLAVATSADFRLVADSIDAIAPKQSLDRVIAVGHAYGEQLGSDIANANVPAIAARDWMRGDTVIAVFVPAADVAEQAVGADTAGAPPPRRAKVDRVIAVGVGDRAKSTYRVRNETDSTAMPGINYLLARRITIRLEDGSVSSVLADGEVQGMYLQPMVVPAAGGGSDPGGSVER